MGRSAKVAKRPTKAEKLSRQVNAPISSLNYRSPRPRSLSPDLTTTASTSTSIPLFNTSRKGAVVPPRPRRTQTKPQQEPQSDGMEPDLDLDLSAPSNDGIDLVSSLASTSTAAPPAHWSSEFPLSKQRHSKPSPLVKMKKAQQAISNDARKADRKLGGGGGGGGGRAGGSKAMKGGKDKFRLGVDYVTLHEKRNGGERFSKKLR
ncbi:BQ2448_8137 [Microbotryum intermedium]|uniref:BQ2448_8137 protein n=1 Tax=Microbotryum intermedium TaxID=269621 RepID=A0A238FTU4_9BASI|nr:BQ2448_8137 [Microbotryum intermedium]